MQKTTDKNPFYYIACFKNVFACIRIVERPFIEHKKDAYKVSGTDMRVERRKKL